MTFFLRKSDYIYSTLIYPSSCEISHRLQIFYSNLIELTSGLVRLHAISKLLIQLKDGC